MTTVVHVEVDATAPMPQYNGQDAPGWRRRTVTPDCGHAVVVEGMASGYAVDQDDRTMCYGCADSAEAARMATADRFDAYVSGDGRTITTWSGGVLARVTSMTEWQGRTPSGGRYDMAHVVARDADGATWSGRGPGAGMYVRLRRKA